MKLLKESTINVQFVDIKELGNYGFLIFLNLLFN